MSPKFQPSPHLWANWPPRPRTRFPSGFFCDRVYVSLCTLQEKYKRLSAGHINVPKLLCFFFVTEFYGDSDDLPGSREMVKYRHFKSSFRVVWFWHKNHTWSELEFRGPNRRHRLGPGHCILTPVLDPLWSDSTPTIHIVQFRNISYFDIFVL